MLAITPQMKILVATRPADFRKGSVIPVSVPRSG